MDSTHFTAARLNNREAAATRIVFFIAGFVLSAWAPLVPFAKSRLGIDDALLGLLMLCLGAGSTIGMPATGILTARHGCRLVIVGASVLAAAALPVLALVEMVGSAAIALFAFGVAIGAIDVAINVQAVIVERASGRALMSGFHGLFSVGGIAGAGGVSLLLGIGASPLAAAAGVGLSVLVLLATAARHLIATPDQAGGAEPRLALPRGPIVLIGALCFICFLAEGAVLDWSALFLATSRGVDPAQAGFGYAAFALAMTLGRLTGDRIVTVLGSGRVLRFGGICAALGFLLAVLAPGKLVAILGFMLVGLGASNIVPVLFSTAGRQTIDPSSHAIAAITTLGYAGVLTGPALIGFLSKATDLNIALAVLAAMMMLIPIGSRRLV
jgi:predicted MFS family arabinose efflux permease